MNNKKSKEDYIRRDNIGIKKTDNIGIKKTDNIGSIKKDNINSVKTETKPQSKEEYLKKNQENKDSYKRPELTYTEKLSKAQLRQILYDYDEIKDNKKLQYVEPGKHIRYFENKDGDMKFRTGGILTVNKYPDYFVLSNGKVSWSVQIKQCIFFVRISIQELREEYEKELIRLNAENQGLHSMLDSLSKKYNILKKEKDINDEKILKKEKIKK